MKNDQATNATPQSLGSTEELGLVERLRLMSQRGHWPLIGDEAADEIERLRAILAQQIDYQQLIADCYTRTKQAQGTRGCVQFARGAEWWREQIIGKS